MRRLSSLLAHHSAVGLLGVTVLVAWQATDWRLALVLTGGALLGFGLGCLVERRHGETGAFLTGAVIPLALGAFLLGGAATTTAWAFGPPLGLLVGFVFGRYLERRHLDGTCSYCPRPDRHVSRPDDEPRPLRRVG